MNDHVTETTALLNSSETYHSLPPILPTLYLLQSRNVTIEEVLNSEHTHSSIEERLAFSLIILLLSYANQKSRPPLYLDIWEDWSEEVQVSGHLHELEQLALELWTQYLKDYRTPLQIQQVLWLAFPEKLGSRRHLRGTSAPLFK